MIPAYEMNGVQVPEQQLNDTEVRALKQGLTVQVGESPQIGLIRGFLTLPIGSSDAGAISEVHGHDHHPREGHVIDYAGDATLSKQPGEPGVFDSHPDWDYGLPIGTYVIAALGGDVEITESANGSLNVLIRHGFYVVGVHEVTTVHGHLKSALVRDGQAVHRGQVIAEVGRSGTSWSHLHFGLLFGDQSPPEPDDYLPIMFSRDPFGVATRIPVQFPVERYGSWTVFNKPQYSR